MPLSQINPWHQEEVEHRLTKTYSKFGNFQESFIFANSIQRHIRDVRNWQIGHDIPISVNDRVILPFREGLNFTKQRICKALRK